MSDREKTLLATILLGLVAAFVAVLSAAMFRMDDRLDVLQERVLRMEAAR